MGSPSWELRGVVIVVFAWKDHVTVLLEVRIMWRGYIVVDSPMAGL